MNEWLGTLVGKQGKPLAPFTHRGIMRTFQMILGRKLDRKLIHFQSELEARRQHPCHSPSQMQAIVDAVREPYKTLFAVAAETGMRAGEAYGLHVEDVDMKRLLIHVRRSIRKGKPQSPKSLRAYRSIDIQSTLAEMIQRHLNGRTSGYVFQTRLGTRSSIRERSTGVVPLAGTAGHSEIRDARVPPREGQLSLNRNDSRLDWSRQR